ncbi:MAG TPA: glycosyltransferase family 4 protein [Ignavibacteriales bacterium]|nr:glycosyltransferase family 4 protein [Ignavibacteriales bacterium]
MRILILSDSDSPHTIKWAKSLSQSNFTIGVFSIHEPNFDLYADFPEILIFSANLPKDLQFKNESAFSKLKYLKAFGPLKKTIKDFKPDIVHAHYITSYGFLGVLANFHPLVISVWGSDIYNFPKHSYLHQAMIKFNLFKADKILSTSEVMKIETSKYTSKNITVTPFGIDTSKFYPSKVQSIFNSSDLVIGTIKTLEKKYGIEYLIKAFKILKIKRESLPLKLLIVGKGSQENILKNLTIKLGIQDDTVFTGFINHENVPDYQNMLDIGVFPSIEDSESFGVAVLEASACGKPVVVSNVGGFPEVVEDGKTGFIVQKQNPEQLAEALILLVDNEKLRNQMGENGMNKVLSQYSWTESVNKMVSIYDSILKDSFKSLYN